MGRFASVPKPVPVFFVGLLFVLLLTAVKIWQTQDGVQPVVHAGEQLVVRELPTPRYRARIAAEEVLSSPAAALAATTAAAPLAKPLDKQPMLVALAVDKPPSGRVIREPAPSPDEVIQPRRRADTDDTRPRIDDGRQARLPERRVEAGAVARLNRPRNRPPIPLPDVQPEESSSASVQQGASPSPLPPPAEKSSFPWPRPRSLEASLARLKAPPAAAWAEQVQELLGQLQQTDSLYDHKAGIILARVAELATARGDTASGDSTVETIPPEQARLWNVVRYALTRRVDVWTHAQKAAQPTAIAEIKRLEDHVDRTEMRRILETLQTMLASDPAGADWSEFLLLSEISEMAGSPALDHADDRAHMARRVLVRMEESRLTDEQREFLEHPEFAQFNHALRGWATRSVPYEEFLAQLEAFDAAGTAATARAVTRDWNVMRWSRDPAQAQLAVAVDRHYRNANVRFTITEPFVNRLLPVLQDANQPVNEVLLGAQVRGRSSSRTRVFVKFLPDGSRIRMRLEALGSVNASTQSFKGPVMLQNRNRARYAIQKMFILDRNGLRIGRSDAVATVNSRLMGMTTAYDRMPIMGSLARRIAKEKAAEQTPLATKLFERRIANRAQRQIDEEVTAQLALAQEKLESKVLARLERMDLQPVALHMQTGEDRMVLRGRMAGNHQLAAYTTRPRALANNLVSLQVHESALNNFIQQLGMDGREGDLSEMVADISRQLELEVDRLTEEVPPGVEVKLAPSDALRVTCDRDQITLTLRIAELGHRRRSWGNFAVRAHYRPVAEGFQVRLQREGVVELVGRRLKFRDQLALRGTFTKVFSQNRTFELIPPEIADDERMDALRVDQFVVREGWIGMSIGQHPEVAAPPADDPRTTLR